MGLLDYSLSYSLGQLAETQTASVVPPWQDPDAPSKLNFVTLNIISNEDQFPG